MSSRSRKSRGRSEGGRKTAEQALFHQLFHRFVFTKAHQDTFIMQTYNLSNILFSPLEKSYVSTMIFKTYESVDNSEVNNL